MWNWLLRVFSPERFVIKLLNALIEENKRMSANFDALAAQVDASVALAASAVTALNDVVSRITALTAQVADLAHQLEVANAGQEDPAKLDELTSKLKTASDALAAAVEVATH